MYLPPYFFCHNTLFFSKDIVLCAMSATQYFFEKNNVVWQVCHNTLLFDSQHIIFSKNIVLFAMSATQYFLKKIMCCDSKSRPNVTCCDIIFSKKYCVVRHVRNTIFFEKNNVL